MCNNLILPQKVKILNDYTYGGSTFKNVIEHRDLGVLMDRKLSFKKHYDIAVSKAQLALGFIKCFCSDFILFYFTFFQVFSDRLVYLFTFLCMWFLNIR